MLQFEFTLTGSKNTEISVMKHIGSQNTVLKQAKSVPPENLL